MSKQTFLIKPLDHLIIRQNPIYRETYFILERLTPELKIDKEEASTKNLPQAKSPEQFLTSIIFSGKPEQMTKRTYRKVTRPGWVLIQADKGTPTDELWRRAMKKVGEKDLYQPQFKARAQ